MDTTAKMGLRVWNLIGDNYDHEQQSDNLQKIDAHDHSPGRGVLIPTSGLAQSAEINELLTDTGWQEPELLNGFANTSGEGFATVAYRLNKNIVRLKGTIYNSGTSGKTGFILPKDYRPLATTPEPLTSLHNPSRTPEGLASAIILANGEVGIYYTATISEAYLSFEGITFTID